MNVIILPLLVAGHLNFNNHRNKDNNHNSNNNTDNGTEEYKQEIIYNVTYNATTRPQNSGANSQTNNSPLISYNFETQLRCWPRAEKILNCRLEEPIVFLSLYNSTSNNSVTAASDDGEKELAKFNFDIRFNRFGVKELVVPSTISPSILDMIRAIVNQFHTGLDINNKTDGTYRSWENFTTGDCFTSFAIKLSNVMLNSNKTTTLPHTNFKKWQPQMTIFINKTRNIEKCRQTAPYFFGSRESWQDNPRVLIHLKSSKSSIVANTTYFVSSTETSLELHNSGPRSTSNIITMLESMSVVFHSISSTKQEIEKIKEPASAGVVTGKWLHDDFSEENVYTSDE